MRQTKSKIEMQETIDFRCQTEFALEVFEGKRTASWWERLFLDIECAICLAISSGSALLRVDARGMVGS